MDAELQFEIKTAVEYGIEFNTNEVIQTIKEKSAWLFTSVNAVKSIYPILVKYQNKFEQKIYCVGKQSMNLLTELGYYSVRMYENEKDLKETFNWNEAQRLTYFCNNNSNNIIPKPTGKDQITVKFVQVYKTTLLKPIVENNHFNYVLYFSPLGVKSILTKNQHLISVPAICSGPTTLKALKGFGVKKCIVPDSPKLKSMVEYILNHR